MPDLANSEESLNVPSVQLQHSTTVAKGELRLALFQVAEREIEIEFLERDPPHNLLFLISQPHSFQLPHCLCIVDREMFGISNMSVYTVERELRKQKLSEVLFTESLSTHIQHY